jgi:2-amino-4-hydroxy-6-hydroxymethyldihydropteridine diphosphokinase
MIFIALGANLPTVDYGTPILSLQAAIDRLCEIGQVLGQSRWYKSAPVPASDQPDFINGIISLETILTPEELLANIHRIEHEFGRQRGIKNEARVLDLDLIDYHGRVTVNKTIELPHPRMQTRGFVLLPLRDIAPGWVHPVSGQTIDQLIAKLPANEPCTPVD